MLSISTFLSEICRPFQFLQSLTKLKQASHQDFLPTPRKPAVVRLLLMESATSTSAPDSPPFNLPYNAPCSPLHQVVLGDAPTCHSQQYLLPSILTLRTLSRGVCLPVSLSEYESAAFFTKSSSRLTLISFPLLPQLSALLLDALHFGAYLANAERERG